MAFTSFKSVDELLIRYAVALRREEFVRPLSVPALRASTRDDLRLAIAEFPFDRSEIATRETIIYPILRDVSLHYRDTLTLFSGEPVEADADLRGEVDYFVSRRSPLGGLVPDQPYLLIGEAKRDDGTGGWNQALGGMLAAQKLGGPAFTYYGVATTGTVWRFGRLIGADFTRDPRPFTVADLDGLTAALHFVFAACRDQVVAPVP